MTNRASANNQGSGRLPWPIREDDLGVWVVDRVGHAMSLEEDWSLRSERGFTWWAKDLAQRVWSDPSFRDQEFEIFRLHARTDLLRDFEASDENLAILNELATVGSLSGYLVDPAAGTVELASSMYAHAGTEDWVKATLQWVAAIQAADAQLKAESLAEVTSSAVAASGHPLSGPRSTPDDMLMVLEDVVAPLGQRASVWEGDEMEWVTEMVQGARYTVMATGDDTGFCAEFPLQSRTSLLTASTEETNPQLGNGALLILNLPMGMEEAEGIRFAFELNHRELASRTNSHFLGSWCWARTTLRYVSFIPNAVRFGRGDLLNLVVSMTGRAKWVAEMFYGDDWNSNVDESGYPAATPSVLDFVQQTQPPPTADSESSAWRLGIEAETRPTTTGVGADYVEVLQAELESPMFGPTRLPLDFGSRERLQQAFLSTSQAWRRAFPSHGVDGETGFVFRMMMSVVAESPTGGQPFGDDEPRIADALNAGVGGYAWRAAEEQAGRTVYMPEIVDGVNEAIGTCDQLEQFQRTGASRRQAILYRVSASAVALRVPLWLTSPGYRGWGIVLYRAGERLVSAQTATGSTPLHPADLDWAFSFGVALWHVERQLGRDGAPTPGEWVGADWETCEIQLDPHRRVFVAVAERAGERYEATWSDPLPESRLPLPARLDKRPEKIMSRHEALVGELRAAGWAPIATSGNEWWSNRFRRRVTE